ncbi:hypothetical protein ACF0H5_013350 [Mactra antiquata]
MIDTKSKSRLIVDDIFYKAKDKVILDGISMTSKSGQIFAIIGQTGSGKTTFLNMIAGRQTPDRGSITLNGKQFDKRLRRNMAFVQQTDVFFSQLTLRETLEFTAHLRIPEDVPTSKKMEKIDLIVKYLHLEKCIDTVIGDIFTKGLSGGEKKRASIACEVLTNPDILLLDEPTSGLDSRTAQNIIEFLQKYAIQNDKLVILTIHQPSSKIYHMFNRLMVLDDGKMAFNGKRQQAISYFTELGAQFETHYNPADYIMEFVSDADSEMKEAIFSKVGAKTRQCVPKFMELNGKIQQTAFQKDYYEDSDTDSLLEETRVKLLQESDIENGHLPKVISHDKNDNKWPTNWCTQYKMLSIRSIKQTLRILKQGYSLVQCLTVAVLCALLYFRIGVSIKTSRDVYGLIFFYVGYWTFIPAMTVIASYGQERVVVVKERASGAYRLSAYFMSKLTSDLPDTFLLPGIMYILFFWIGDFGGASEFFATLAIMYLQTFCCFGLGLFLSVLCHDVRMAITSLFSYLISMYLLGGFFSRNVPYWMEWIKYCSIFYYPYAFTISVMTARLEDVPCNSTLAETFPGCLDNSTSIVTPEHILADGNVSLRLHTLLIIMIAYTIVIRSAAYIVLRVKNDKLV